MDAFAGLLGCLLGMSFRASWEPLEELLEAPERLQHVALRLLEAPRGRPLGCPLEASGKSWGPFSSSPQVPSEENNKK